MLRGMEPAIVDADATTDEPDPRAVAAERLTFFADAVIAIAITLLALDLPVPEGRTNHEVLHEVAVHRGEYISFLISFFVIGRFWTVHHRVFRFVNRLDGRLSAFSLLWLMMMVITPFATRVLSEDGAFQFRFILYASVQATACILFALMVREITVHRLYRPDTPLTTWPNAYFGTLSFAAAFLLSIPVSFLAPDYSYTCWIFIPVLLGLGRRFWRRRPRAHAERS
jgi:uncharacterized membrane protein